jgi:hypothetical protein
MPLLGSDTTTTSAGLPSQTNSSDLSIVHSILYPEHLVLNPSLEEDAFELWLYNPKHGFASPKADSGAA